MALIGKTYYCGNEGKLKVYNHATSTWTDKSIGTGILLYDVKTSTGNYDKIIVGGLSRLYYSTDAGTTLIMSLGDWSTFVQTIYQISYTTNPDIIYAVGQGGIVKSIDGGISFNRLNSFTTNSGLLCFTTHFINDLVGVASQGPKLYKTIDGGVIWTPLYTGNVLDGSNPTDAITGVHLSADQSTVIATTRKKIFRSTDGGNGFTMVNYYGTGIADQGQSPKYNHLAWLNDNILINSAGKGNVLYSYNAGASWSSTVGQELIQDSKSGSSLFQPFTTPGAPVGFFNSDVNQTIYELQQLDLTTFTTVASDTYSKNVYSITSLVLNVTCYVLTPCDQTGNVIVAANSEFSTYVNGYVNIDGSCFYVTEGEDCSNTIHVNYTNIISVANCSACNPPEVQYGLRDCSSQQPTIYTTEALTPGIATYLGDVVTIAGYPNTCWTVVELGGTPQAIVILNSYKDCATCIGVAPSPPPVYKLTNCLNDQLFLYTLNSQFALALNLVVKVTEDPSYCFIVTEVPFDDQTTIDLTILENEQGVLQIFDNCECCLPTPEPAPVKYVRTEPKPDRIFYQISQSQCDITANIKFANAYYALFKKLKHGMGNCCDNLDLEKVWMDKELSDYAMINDPSACTIVTPVTPIVCPEPS